MSKYMDIATGAQKAYPRDEEKLKEAARLLQERLLYDELSNAGVVFCKDCKYWLPHTQCGNDADYDEYHNYCKYHMPDDEWYAGYWNADDYCSYGEREENSDG